MIKDKKFSCLLGILFLSFIAVQADAKTKNILDLNSTSIQSFSPPALYTPANSFTAGSHIVSTSVFVWYPGQVSGPWLPLDGISNWDSSVEWWKTQVKQMMTANIDVLFVHLLGGFTQNRTNLFQALSELRAIGYDVPKVAPFLDTAIIWNGRTLDLSTTSGKDEFVGHYINFFYQYYSVNTDLYADDFVDQIDGRVVLDCYVLSDNILNVGAFTRNDMESRLIAAFGASHPIFNNGIHMIQIVAGSDFVFTDEKIVQFENNSYYFPYTFNTITSVMLKGGYWDQNIRDPGAILPRNGGVDYINAWTTAVANRSALRHAYIESWNEYDEGSGIYAVDTVNSPYVVPGNPGNDNWSVNDDPFEYIKSTAEGARLFNDRPNRNAKILWHNFPVSMHAGERQTVQVVVRNEGDLMWSENNKYRFGQKEFLLNEILFGPARYFIDDVTNEVNVYGGVFRGRSVVFEFELIAPKQTGEHLTHWAMLQENVAWFGEELSRTITVYDRGDLDENGVVNEGDLGLLVGQWTESNLPCNPTPETPEMLGDINSDCLVNLVDFAILSWDWSQ